MYKIAPLILTILAACTISTLASDVILLPSNDKTSEDIALKFELEKTKWDGKDLKVWGKVKNTGQKSFWIVEVFLTAQDNNRNFITRESMYTVPAAIDAGQVGYIEKWITCEGKKPAYIEFSVLGK